MADQLCSQKCRGFVKKNMKLVITMFFIILGVLGTVVVAEIAESPITIAIPDKELRLVHVVFRHGARTPADTYPNDVYFNHTFHPYGWGQLTNAGRSGQFNSGVFLRKRYNDFLGNLFSTPLVYAESTEPDRSFMSCALTLAGLWPTKNTELDWNPDLNWSPIRIKSQPLNEDVLLLARKSCPRYFEELADVMNSTEVQKVYKENEELFKKLTNITGMPISSPDDVQSLYNTLKAEKEYGLNLPEWTKEYYPDKLVPLTAYSFELNAYNNELKKLKGGPLVKKIISDWTSKVQGKLSPKDRKIFVYGGHDSTVSNLMLALGGWDTQIPEYGIMVLLELYEDVRTKEYGVEIYLRNTTSTEPTPITIKGCEPFCPLNKLIELTKEVVPENWEKECKSRDPNYVPPPPSGP